MANPADTRSFEYWITSRINFQVAEPGIGDTGDFESWLWDREYWENYAKAQIAGFTDGIGRGIAEGVMRGVG